MVSLFYDVDLEKKMKLLAKNTSRRILLAMIFIVMNIVGCGAAEEKSVFGESTQAQSETSQVEAASDETKDVTPPVLTGVQDYNIIQGEEIAFLENVSATDETDGQVQVSIDLGEYNPECAGTYIVTFRAKDAAGNEVSEDCQVVVEPKLIVVSAGKQILGTESFEMYVGEAFDPMAGIALSDAFSSDAQVEVDVSGLDTSKEGVYSVVYRAVNLRGQTVQVNRQVVVKHVPVMYTLPGGTASWDVAGIEGQPYMVCVNRLMNTVTVYGKDENGNYTVPVTAMVCSVGREGEETPTGTYVTSNRYDWRLLVDGTWGRYAIRVHGSILFHSVPYFTPNAGDIEYEEFNKLGSPASLGCIRLQDKDIYWLYTNCPTGFVTVIYDDAAIAGPLGKPTAPIIDVNNEELRGWDPTDPGRPQP